ncbi:hypothetical protein MTO96_020869 [Rhipicephalus appendiculatus]
MRAAAVPLLLLCTATLAAAQNFSWAIVTERIEKNCRQLVTPNLLRLLTTLSQSTTALVKLRHPTSKKRRASQAASPSDDNGDESGDESPDMS